MEFDRELHSFRSISCANYQCQKPQIDCSCDYTDRNECPKTTGRDASCPPCPTFIEIPTETPYTLDYCSGDSIFYDWQTLEANVEKTFEVSDGFPLFFRYKANTKICEGLRLYVTPEQGSVSTYISTLPSDDYLGRYSPSTDPEYITMLNICPTDNRNFTIWDSWTRDTYFIRVTPSGNYAKFSMLILSKEVPQTQVASSCDQILTTHKCIIDGSINTGSGSDEELQYYTYSVDKPQVLSISFPSLQEDIDFFISDNPTYKFPGSKNNFAKWEGTNELDDYLTISIKPLENGQPRILYITISTFYKSNFTFTVTSQGYYETRPITAGNQKGGTYNLVKTSSLILPTGTIQRCDAFTRCKAYTSLFPLRDVNPLWPIPPNFANDKRFEGITFVDDSNPIQKNHYTAAFLLSVKQSSTLVNADFSEVSKSKISFLNSLVDSNGNPLEGEFGFEIFNLTCNYPEFKEVFDEINKEESSLFNTSNFLQVNKLRFKIDTLTIRDSWAACSQEANSLLQTEMVTSEVNTTYCPYKLDDPQYIVDPCCNSSATFFKCCVPRPLEVSIQKFVGVHDDLVSDKCSSFDCTRSVLEDYHQSQAAIEDCTVPSSVSTSSHLQLNQVLRDCKAELRSIQCNKDSDCGGYQCDLYLRSCIIPVEVADRKYLSCVYKNIPPQIYYTITHQKLDEESFINQILNTYSSEDCTYITGFSYRTIYSYESAANFEQRCYSSPKCIDLTCETVHDVCYDGYYGSWSTFEHSALGICDKVGFCQIPINETFGSCFSPYDSGEVNQECINDCNNIGSYCGFCGNNLTDCYKFAEVNQVDCKQDRDVCLLPRGGYALDVSPAECEQMGQCDTPCGYECKPQTDFLGCYNPLIFREEDCTLTNTVWNSTYKICIYNSANTPQKCSALATTHHWVDCPNSPISECFDLCYVQPLGCTKEQCLGGAGSCSDSFFFEQKNVPRYPSYLGKCVRPHYVWKTNWPIPTCLEENEKDSPNGCYSIDPEVFDEESCKKKGPEYKWWTPVFTKDECLEPKGCRVLDKNFYNLPYNFRFNEMTQDLCTGCGSDSFNTWTNKFKWTEATWEPGVPVKMSWLNNKFIYTGTKKKVLNYQSLFKALDEAVNIHIADLYRSESLCRMKRIEENLKSIACSCSGPGGKECFTSSSLLLGETKPCTDESSTFRFSYGMILFYPKSVPAACANMQVAQLSKQLFKSTTSQTLSSNFVSYRKPENFGVLNSKKAVVGTLLGDGVKLSSSGIYSMSVCFTYNGNTDKRFNILDFAAENSSSLVPLQIETYHYQAIDPSTNQNVNYICANFSNIESTVSYFPINRIKDWDTANKVIFDETAKGLIYTLAVIFVAVGVWGIFQLVVVVYKRVNKLEVIKLVHLLILIVTIFILIRAIYFFILPSGSLSSNPVGDYILVVLPTFMYFTAFTIIIVLWYMIVKTKQSGKSLVKRLYWMILSINAVLYILFMIIILVFHFSEKNPSNDCGARIVIPASNTTPQRVVSIVYAVFQALISLVIGSAFIYLGGTLYLAMRFNKVSEKSSSSNQQQKVFIVTFACSIGFILHCVFVLILVGAEPSNIVFSFLGLIITEIIPSVSIFYSYNQGSLVGIKQSTQTVNLPYVTPNSESFKPGTGKGDNSSYSGVSNMNSSTSRNSTRD
eukprot:gene2244-2767_t